MYERIKYLLVILSFAGGYKLSDYDHSPKINASDGTAISEAEPNRPFEALKSIQNFVYPKTYDSTDSIESGRISRNITMDDIDSDNLYTKLDQNLIESKHAIVENSPFDHHGLSPTTLLPNGSLSNLSTILQLIDPLFLMAVLGTLAYIINAVLSLVNRIHLTKLLGTPSATSSYYGLNRRQQESTMPSTDVNRDFLQDLERIFRIAIDLYEKKM